MAERPRLLVLDLLESYARQRDVAVRVERHQDGGGWTCELLSESGSVIRKGTSAREAIMRALEDAGVQVPWTG